MLEKIPEGQLSTRAQTIAAALAMIKDGSSINGASKACGIPYSTLHRYHHHLSKLDSKEGDGMALAMEDLQKSVMVASTIATERVLERLVDPAHPWKDGDLIKAQGVNIDKTLALRDTGKGAADPGISAFAAILEANNITISKRDASHDAIDVTPDEPDK